MGWNDQYSVNCCATKFEFLDSGRLALEGVPDVGKEMLETRAVLKDLQRRLVYCETRVHLLDGLAQEEAVRRLARWWRTILLVRRMEQFAVGLKYFLEARSNWKGFLKLLPSK